MSNDSVTISADVSLDTVRDRIGVGKNEELRNSSRRQEYLQKFARIMTAEKLRLLLHPKRSDTDFEEDPPKIRISSEEWEQPITKYPRKIYEMLMQETITLHEIGHMLYTDGEKFLKTVKNLDDSEQPLFHGVFNAFEDGAIEAQLRGEFSVADEILVLRANLMNQNGAFGTSNGSNKYMYTFHEATICAIMDYGCYDTGDLRQLMDKDDIVHNFARENDYDLFKEFLPTIKDYVGKILSEPNGGKRVELIEEFFEDYKDWIDEAEVGGMAQAQNKQKEPVVVEVPDFSASSGGNMSGSALDSADAIHLPDKEELEEKLNDEDSGYVGGEIDEDNPHEEIDTNIVDEYGDEVRREAEDAAGGQMEEMEEYHEMLSELADENSRKGASDGPLQQLEVDFAIDGQGDYDRFDETRRRSRMLKQALARRLQREERSREKRNQRRGKLDTKNLTRASRGNPRIFTRPEEKDEKEYSCMIVLDRSGSMSGQNIKVAEESVGALAKALEDLDINTSILDLYGFTPRVSLPFNGELRDSVETVFTQDCGGGTPLAQTVELAHHRLERMAQKQPFMIVVTDDRPANPEDYQEALDSCNFPVIGVTTNIGGYTNQSNAGDYFHRHVSVTSEGEMYSKLQSLCEEVFF